MDTRELVNWGPDNEGSTQYNVGSIFISLLFSSLSVFYVFFNFYMLNVMPNEAFAGVKVFLFMGKPKAKVMILWRLGLLLAFLMKNMVEVVT